MKAMVEWLVSVCAGVLFSTQATRALKVVNEESGGPDAVELSVYREREEPYIMGSEQLSAVLQKILSSEEIVCNHTFLAGAFQDKNCSECTLGSESLDRMLEDLLAQSSSDNKKFPEPAIQL